MWAEPGNYIFLGYELFNKVILFNLILFLKKKALLIYTKKFSIFLIMNK